MTLDRVELLPALGSIVLEGQRIPHAKPLTTSGADSSV